MTQKDLVIIGGGPAGMAAAVAAYENGVTDILILDREESLGGILKQCIHPGFGLHAFGEELTGPEYSWKFEQKIDEYKIDYKLDTMVINISEAKIITAVNSADGVIKIKARAIVFCMGCRERTRGALNIPGFRPAGIFTAGAAQRFVNLEGYLPGKKVVILGSGDIGLIMARRMTLEGAEVKMVCELLPYSGGLNRNIVQCLEDFNIPLKLSHTIIKIHGNERLEGVTIAKVDESRNPIMGTDEYVECDTLLLSVGLIPENELSKEAGVKIDNVTTGPIVNESMETSEKGIFACGNVVHVHDLVDNVSAEAKVAGKRAAQYILGNLCCEDGDRIKTIPGKGIRYIVPHEIRKSNIEELVNLYFRVDDVYRNVKLLVRCGDEILHQAKKIILAPGEMECVKLPKDKIGNGDVSILIEN